MRFDPHRFTGLIHPVTGEYVLRKIDSDSGNRHGLPLSLMSTNRTREVDFSTATQLG